ncbi:MAG: polysaccharide biosynthesis/export family protein [Sandaracinaceae bacterium]|nr:polysaccharide biosynthesis/export family protein [Sandaracinaceae bacterium]
MRASSTSCLSRASLRHRIAAWVLIPTLASAFAPACGSAPPSSGVPEVAGNDTTLGAGDVFDVRVFGEEELTGSYRVAQDGSIDFPLIGRIAVQALEPTAIADLITARLHDGGILVNPHISVLVREYNSKRVSVLGSVARPGTFAMSAGLTLVQAISLAGGFTSLASRNDIVVTRRVNGELRRYRVRADDVTEGRSDDFALGAGDTIYVPERVF